MRFSSRAYVLLLALAMTSFGAFAKKTFVYCSEGSPSTFNPQMGTDGPTINASSKMLYNRLVTFERGGTKVVPSLAKEWTTSKDGLTFTFTLRKDVKFHSTSYFKPSRNFNADDVVFSFNRQRFKEHPYHKVNGGTYEYFNSMEMGKIIKDIVKIDDHTVKFVLSRPEAPFLANLAMDFASILSKEYGDKLKKAKKPEEMAINPVGTGPYVFKKYQKDNLIRYTSNAKYFMGSPKVDRVVFAITPDPHVRFQKLKAGECHFIAEPSPIDLEAMKQNKTIAVLERPGLNIGYLAMNVEKKPLDDKRVRQAIHHALNRGSYIKAIYKGNAKVAKNPIPPTMWSYAKDVTDYEYSIEKAKDLLKSAGVKMPMKLDLWTLPVSRPYNPNGKKMGELIQADLKKIGIQVNLVSYDWPTYLAKARKGDHQMIQLGWTGDNGDPDNFLNVLLGCAAVKAGSNVARWCDKKFESLVDKAKATTDLKARSEFYKEAQQIFKTEIPWVTLAHAKVFKAMSARVKGYQLSPFGTEDFSEIDLK
ncbi:MAG: ABC transporter substrate-binding protein [Bdellovibrionales bacterium]|nr:ABC transporter substrate-binding protein [Bdellovibrionales bacterium]